QVGRPQRTRWYSRLPGREEPPEPGRPPRPGLERHRVRSGVTDPGAPRRVEVMNAPRLATPRDIDGLLRLMEAFNAGEGIPWKPARTREALLKLFSAPELGFVVLTEEASAPSAYAVITYNFDLEFGGLDCMLTEIFVSPALRGRGVA